MTDESEAGRAAEEMFPSGPWIGYYLYGDSGGRHRMELALTFQNGLMEGGGSDDVDLFAIRGRYDVEKLEVWWIKLYPTHDVFYRGFREGRGIWGMWKIGESLRGGFKIWPKGLGEAEASRAEEEVPVEDAVVPTLPGAQPRQG